MEIFKSSVIALFCLISNHAFGEEIFALVSQKCPIDRMDFATLKNYYRGKISNLGENQVQLFYLSDKTHTGKLFFQKIGLSQPAFENMWNEFKLSGRTNVTITKLNSEEELLTKVGESSSHLGVATLPVQKLPGAEKVKFLPESDGPPSLLNK